VIYKIIFFKGVEKFVHLGLTYVYTLIQVPIWGPILTITVYINFTLK